jgi:ABC-type branched-subunit amino acid transport system ATPase component
LLEVAGLTKRFGGFLAVNRVDFAVQQGEILGLIGPNGSSKTTTFNLIAGTLAPTAGSIRFEGREIAGLPAHRVCRLGLARTFQIPRPFRKLSLRDNVALSAYFARGGHIARAEAERRAGSARSRRPAGREALRIAFGIYFIGAANTIYGVLLILFIIFMPRGIVGLAEEVFAYTVRRWNGPVRAPMTRG